MIRIQMPKDPVKLLEAMRLSKAKWKRRDIVALYEGFGFVIEHGSKHDKVYHPGYPQLIEGLPRHRKLPKVYVGNAVKLVDKLKELEHTSLK